MADLAKWSKECKDCGRRYPTMCGIATCLECKKELERVQKVPTVEEEEFKHLSYIHGRIVPASLTEEELERVERDWAEMEAESEKRGSRWSVADLIGEGFSVRHVA